MPELLLPYQVNYTRDHYRDIRCPLNGCCHLSDRVCEHVDEHSPFRSYVMPLQLLEHMCLAMTVLNTASIQPIEGMLWPVLKVDANPFNNL